MKLERNGFTFIQKQYGLPKSMSIERMCMSEEYDYWKKYHLKNYIPKKRFKIKNNIEIE